jgi:SRSO17 transposase
MDEQQLRQLKPELDRFLDRFVPLFGADENQAHARRFVQGLLRGGDRRNTENIAEAMAGGPVRNLQAFITTGAWSDRAVLDELRRAVVEVRVDPDAVLNVDETGFPKKGTDSVGVQRQYSGTLGRTDNCQIGVFANYASRHGHTVLDRRLYRPEEWAADRPRRDQARVPTAVVFRTKPELALEMVSAALAAGVPFRWVGGDGVYGDNPTFVRGVRGLGKWYVLDTAGDTLVWTAPPQVLPADLRPRPRRGRRPTQPQVTGERTRVDAVIAALPPTAWRRVMVGTGSQGPRVYEYAEIPVWFAEDGLPGPAERLLVRRSIGPEPDLQYHRSNAPAEIGLDRLAEVRGTRWTIEEDFQTGKGECGLDEYETRRWAGWHHHTALSMIALAFLVVQKHRVGGKRAADDRPRGPGLARPSAGRPDVGRGRDPAVVPVAAGAEPPRVRQPPQAPARRLAALPK